MAIANAVKASEVGRGLCGRKDIVGRDSDIRVRQGDFLNDSAKALQLLHGCRHRSAYAGMDARDEVFLRQSDPQAFDVLANHGSKIRNLGIQRSAVARILAAQMIQQEGCVFNGSGKRADLVQGRCKGHQAVARDAPVSGLKSDEAAMCRWLADGATCIRAEGGNGHS